MDLAFEYLVQNKGGLCTEASYQYIELTSFCKAATCDTGLPQGAVVGYMDVPYNNEEALMSAVAQQPVSVAIEADQSAIMYYHFGIIWDCLDSAIDHAVLLVGYGTEGGLKYWKVKNSWGMSWGEHGYFRIARDDDDTLQCGIKSMASYPVVRHGSRTTGVAQLLTVVA